MLSKTIHNTAGVRRAGAAALDMCYVAAGRLDAYFETGLHSWDLAAGALIVREAGGIVSGLDGSENFLETGHVLTERPASTATSPNSAQQKFATWYRPRVRADRRASDRDL